MSDAATLSTVRLFKKLGPEGLAKLAARCTHRRCPAGEVLCRKGDAGDAMFVILSGSVKIGVGVGKSELVFAHLKAGDAFGELALLDGQPRSADATADAPGEILVVPKDAFQQVLVEEPSLSAQLLSELALRLNRTDERRRDFSTRNVNEVAHEHQTFGDRMADRVAQYFGSWGFVGSLLVSSGAWFALNAVQVLFKPFDPYPYNFFNFVLSVAVSLQAPLILMSQNRQSAKDAIQNDLDFETNLKNEIEIRRLHEKLDAMDRTRRVELKALSERASSRAVRRAEARAD